MNYESVKVDNYWFNYCTNKDNQKLYDVYYGNEYIATSYDFEIKIICKTYLEDNNL